MPAKSQPRSRLIGSSAGTGGVNLCLGVTHRWALPLDEAADRTGRPNLAMLQFAHVL
jgi:hypothetical protein